MRHKIRWIDASSTRINTAHLPFVVVDELDRMLFKESGRLGFDKRRHFVASVTTWKQTRHGISPHGSCWNGDKLLCSWQMTYAQRVRTNESGLAEHSWPRPISRHQPPFPCQLYPYPSGLSLGAWFPPDWDWTMSMIHLHRHSRCPIQFLQLLQLKKKEEKELGVSQLVPDEAILSFRSSSSSPWMIASSSSVMLSLLSSFSRRGRGISPLPCGGKVLPLTDPIGAGAAAAAAPAIAPLSTSLGARWCWCFFLFLMIIFRFNWAGDGRGTPGSSF